MGFIITGISNHEHANSYSSIRNSNSIIYQAYIVTPTLIFISKKIIIIQRTIIRLHPCWRQPPLPHSTPPLSGRSSAAGSSGSRGWWRLWTCSPEPPPVQTWHPWLPWSSLWSGPRWTPWSWACRSSASDPRVEVRWPGSLRTHTDWFKHTYLYFRGKQGMHCV